MELPITTICESPPDCCSATSSLQAGKAQGDRRGRPYFWWIPHDELSVRLILVETPPTFSPQPTRVDHLDQQRARSVLGIAQTIVQHPHDVEADVDGNDIDALYDKHSYARCEHCHCGDRHRDPSQV